MKKRIFIFILLLLMAIPMMFLCSCGDEELDDGQLSVTLSSSGKKLKITVVPDSKLLNDHEKDDIYLFAVSPGGSFEDVFENDEPIAKKNASEKVNFKLPLVDKESGLSRLYHGFAAAFYDEDKDTYVLATSVAYVKNPEKLSDNSEDFPTAKSIKGICAEYDTDAVALGVSHVIIDIPIEDYILAEGAPFAESNTVGRTTVFIDGDALRKLDGRIKYYTDNGVNVYLRFMLKKSAEELPEGLKDLAYPGTAAGGTSYAVNMNDKNTAVAVAGLADLLAGRYAIEDGAYGHVCSFIAGVALNTPGETAPGVGSDAYFDGVVRFARTLYTALASHYENGRVYISVDHRWKTAGVGEADRTGHKFLTAFAESAKAAGDYPWGVAVMTQATSADPDRIWYDNSGDGDYLTPSNLEAIFDDFIDSSKNCFEGEERPVIVSGFAVENTGSADTEANQAASYAYAYYKAVDTGKIGAFIYSAQIDTDSSSAGLRYLTEEGIPGAEKEIYRVMKAIGTDTDIEELVEGTSVEDSDWETVYGRNNESVMSAILCDGRGKVESGDLEELLEDYRSSALFDFSQGNMNGFYCAGNGSYAGLTESGLKLSCVNPSPAEIGYIYKSGLTKSDFPDDSILIQLSEVKENCRVTLVLIQKNGKKTDVIYESTALDIKAGTPALLDFDISSFRDELIKGDIEMRISAVGEGGSPCGITVEKILTGKEKSNTVIVIILIVLASSALVAIVVLGVIWFRKHYKIEFERSPKKGKTSKKAKEKSNDAEFYE